MHAPSKAQPRCRCHVGHRASGFTLIELMIAVAIVAVLATIALPIFRDSIRKSHRAEAFTALSAVQLAQERWRANKTQYTVTLSDLVPSIPSPTSSGYYTITLSAPPSPADTRTGYVATATAGGAQSGDSNCAKLAVQMVEGILKYGSGNGSIDWTDPNRCWAR